MNGEQISDVGKEILLAYVTEANRDCWDNELEAMTALICMPLDSSMTLAQKNNS